MRNAIYISLFYFLSTVSLLAQQLDLNGRQLYLQAENEYQIGHIDSAIHVLETNMPFYKGPLKISVCRLLALCFLANDEIDKANICIDQLLAEDPYYSISLQDPIRFSELIRKKRKGNATLVTASQQIETLEETPVPVTLITEDMIKAIGGRTLKDVLIAYVPGMNDVASANEVNVAMRGVYTVGQQKILIMLNGHRLNSRSYNGANPDFSISLEKVKQIEVLRGPASSLYGNVALTSVINIISKEGHDIDGVKVKLGIGSYGERKADLLVGKRYLHMDFMGWASVYKSDGEHYQIGKNESLGLYPRNGYAILGGYRDKPSFDYGFTFKLSNFSMLFNQRYSKMIEPFNSLDNPVVNPGGVHDYDKYRLWDGNEGPGAGFGFIHSELKYQNTYDRFSFDVTAYYDNNRNNYYTALGDTADIPAEALQRYGPWQLLIWNEYALGVYSKASIQYGSGMKNYGNFVFGVQIEYMNLYNQLRCDGYNYTEIGSVNDFLKTGGESSYSVFVQNKHNFSRSWIFNAGIRFDYKARMKNNSVTAVSPRISLVYHPSDQINAKASYARSFVDAPYFYRYNFGIESFTGNENLKPENLDSWQFTLGGKPVSPLNLEMNLFYNRLTNFIYNDKKADIENKESPFKNAGKLQSIGIEGTASFEISRFSAQYNITWQRVLNGENYSFRDSRVFNIPPITSNLILNGILIKTKKWGDWSLKTNLTFTSAQLSPIEGVRKSILIGGNPVISPDNEVVARLLWNAGFVYRFHELEFDFQCYNLLNNRYCQGGTTVIPYIQPGRWISISLSYKF